MPETPWFAVDRKGLKQILARKGKEFILFELIQNAWDEKTTKVSVSLSRIPRTRKVHLKVEDNNPEGFADLTHSFTLFAESKKKKDAEKRGRFNLGEKLVLALCEEAEIASTTGTVAFREDGRHQVRSRTLQGSIFRGVLAMTDEELKHCHVAVQELIPPSGVQTFYNDVLIPARPIVKSFTATLTTEIADPEGSLRPTKRKTTVEIYEPLPGETPTLYEMGIPVVGTGDRWHINVKQKVPLNVDRDNVSPAYLAYVRALVLDHMQASLNEADANSTWVKDAVQRYGEDLSDVTVHRLVDLKFGDLRVAYDPSDPEANSLAVSKGYTVVHGGSLSKEEWGIFKRAGAILPAGQVTPSPKPFDPDGRPLVYYPSEKWTPAMHKVVNYVEKIAFRLLKINIQVYLVDAPRWFAAVYRGRGSHLEELFLNVADLGVHWFSGDLAEINDLLIHEFGHHYAGDHLSSKYHDALTRLGGALSVLALREPELFQGVLPQRLRF